MIHKPDQPAITLRRGVCEMNGDCRLIDKDADRSGDEQLLRRIDEDILDHEERDLFSRIEREIQGVEETQIISNRDAMVLVDQSARRRLARLSKRSRNRNAARESPIQKLKFVRAKQFIPRSKKRKATKVDVRSLLLHTLAEHEARRLTTADMKGFQLVVSSASSNAWSIEVVGFPRAVQACLSLLQREVARRRF